MMILAAAPVRLAAAGMMPKMDLIWVSRQAAALTPIWVWRPVAAAPQAASQLLWMTAPIWVRHHPAAMAPIWQSRQLHGLARMELTLLSRRAPSAKPRLFRVFCSSWKKLLALAPPPQRCRLRQASSGNNSWREGPASFLDLPGRSPADTEPFDDRIPQLYVWPSRTRPALFHNLKDTLSWARPSGRRETRVARLSSPGRNLSTSEYASSKALCACPSFQPRPLGRSRADKRLCA